ncbi:MAG: two pore domain potassium channel family protein [Proteobacteria bacterium]|nr:MAG: two pore domain potassium channel family protein [Pseudomonadota bacterium]QKK10687.1 MAG: two pore domain potassium channel family protein [Pseudomonadota bacterium]
MWLAVTLAVVLVVATFLTHFSMLRWLSGGMGRIPMRKPTRMIAIVLATLAAHLVEIGLYAGVIFVAAEFSQMGGLGGVPVAAPLDYLYYSAVTFTSLGLGDVFPVGHLRFLTGVEALNGLLLIAWSGSFIYIAMGRLWQWQPCAEPRCSKSGDRTKVV